MCCGLEERRHVVALSTAQHIDIQLERHPAPTIATRMSQHFADVTGGLS
jgi:hypothetical protein